MSLISQTLPEKSGVSKLKWTAGHHVNKVQGLAKKNLAKFSDTCSVRADGLCIGSPRLVGGRKAGNSNMQEFFCTMLYINCLFLNQARS